MSDVRFPFVSVHRLYTENQSAQNIYCCFVLSLVKWNIVVGLQWASGYSKLSIKLCAIDSRSSLFDARSNEWTAGAATVFCTHSFIANSLSVTAFMGIYLAFRDANALNQKSLTQAANGRCFSLCVCLRCLCVCSRFVRLANSGPFKTFNSKLVFVLHSIICSCVGWCCCCCLSLFLSLSQSFSSPLDTLYLDGLTWVDLLVWACVCVWVFVFVVQRPIHLRTESNV